MWLVRRVSSEAPTHRDACGVSLARRGRGLSPRRSACRHFKTDTGVTFREYLAYRRVARAAELLRGGSRSVSEVYLDVGFKDLSRFGCVFRLPIPLSSEFPGGEKRKKSRIISNSGRAFGDGRM